MVQHHFIGVDPATGSLATIESAGNPHCHVVLRGGSAGTNYDAEAVSQAAETVSGGEAEGRRMVMVDCSHANSQKQHDRQLVVVDDLCEQIADAGASRQHNDICGVMIESHINGKQAATPHSPLPVPARK